MTILRAHRRWFAVLKWLLFFVILAVIILHVSIKFWIGPAYVETQIKKNLADFWAGPVHVGEINFGYDGIMFVSEISFCDADREVMKAAGVKLVLGNWPSLTAPAKIINVKHLDARLRAENRKLNLPLVSAQKSSEGESPLEYMDINSITLTVESGGSKTAFDRMFADVLKDRGFYKLKIGNNEVNDGYLLKIDGVFDLAKGSADIDFKFSQKITPQEMKVFLSSAGMQGKWDCGGKVAAELGIKGKFSDIESLWPKGFVNFEDWTIIKDGNTICSNTDTVLIASNHRLDFQKLKGDTFGGFFKGVFYLDFMPPRPVSYGGYMRFEKIDMAKLTEMAFPSRRLNKGTGFLKILFHGDVNDFNDSQARGTAFLDNADLWKLPLIGELFKVVGASDFKLAGLSDAELKFDMRGPKMTIERARLSNSLSALAAQRGGKVDLSTRQVDFYVVGLPIKGLDKILSGIPVINWFVRFKDKIIRLRVNGDWNEPADKLIRKEPIEDVGAATIGFFVDMIQTGGDLTDGMKNIFGNNHNVNQPDR
jgi:hypothetical protein